MKSLEGLVCCNTNYKEPKECPNCNQKWKYPASSLLFHDLLGNFVFKNHRVCMQLYLFLIVFELWPCRNSEDDHVKRWLVCPGALEFIRPKQPGTYIQHGQSQVKLSCSLLRGFLWLKMTSDYDPRTESWLIQEYFLPERLYYVRSSYKTQRNLIGSSGTFYISLVIAHLPWWYSKCHGKITWCPSLT